MVDETADGGVSMEDLVRDVLPPLMEKISEQIDKKLAGICTEFAAEFEKAQLNTAAKVEAKGADLVAKLTEKDKQAAQHVASLNSNKGAAETTLNQIKDYNTQSKTALDTTIQNRDKVVSLGQRADELNAQIETLKADTEQAHDHVVEFQMRWTENFDALFAKVEGLLPGATGAGLASGFHEEKEAYEKKQRMAHLAFIGFLILLVVTLVFTPLQVFVGRVSVGAPIDALDLLKRMLWNLPIVAPVIWGAWWFNRLASLYDRLAEEYRQKEAISKAFDGYTKQIMELKQDKALSDYLLNALREVCVPAGRVYDKKMPPATPWEDQLDKIATIVAEKMRKGNLPAKP